jgi:hypothetical protein
MNVLTFLLGVACAAVAILTCPLRKRGDTVVDRGKMSDRELRLHLRLIEWLLRKILVAVLGIVFKMKRGRLQLGLHLIKPKEGSMDPVVLNSEQKVLISVNPLKPNGEADPDVDVTFSSSDPSVGIEEQADGRSAFILTPAESGSAQINIQASGYDSETLDVSYSPPQKGKLNVSVGSPQSDLEA